MATNYELASERMLFLMRGMNGKIEKKGIGKIFIILLYICHIYC